MKKIHVIFTVALIFLTILLRLYNITAPVADWHSFRQTDTASVAQLFVRDGIDLLHPRYHDLSNIQSGHDNPTGYRMVEFPLYQGVAAYVARFIPTVSVDIILRAITILSAAGTAFLLVLFVSQFTSPLTGLLTGFVYAILPYSIFYGRSILPETFAVFWAMLSIYLLTKKHVFFSALAGGLALLVKPTAGFLLVPIPYLLYRQYGFSLRLLILLFSYSLISLFPLWGWRNWIMQYPEGIPVYDWLLNKDNIRFKGAWFYWLFAKRLGDLILGYWGLIPFGIGLMGISFLDGLLVLGGLLYLIVFAAGNVQHDYYQIILIPIISIIVARGLTKLWKQSKVLTFVSVLFMVAFSWYTMRTYYWINRPEIIEAGKMADKIIPKNAKVIAPYNGDTTFLYQTKRQGWPLGFDIDEKIAMGATHYVTVSPTDSDWETKTLAEQYTVMVRNDTFAIIDLTRPR